MDDSSVKFQAPDERHMDNVYEGEALNIIAILKKSELNAEKVVNLKLMNTLTQLECEYNVVISPDMIKQDDDYIFSIAAKQMIQRSQRDNNEKDKIIEVSVKYSVLSRHTAMFGQIKQKLKDTEDMKMIEIAVLAGRTSSIIP